MAKHCERTVISSLLLIPFSIFFIHVPSKILGSEISYCFFSVLVTHRIKFSVSCAVILSSAAIDMELVKVMDALVFILLPDFIFSFLLHHLLFFFLNWYYLSKSHSLSPTYPYMPVYIKNYMSHDLLHWDSLRWFIILSMRGQIFIKC